MVLKFLYASMPLCLVASVPNKYPTHSNLTLNFLMAKVKKKTVIPIKITVSFIINEKPSPFTIIALTII